MSKIRVRNSGDWWPGKKGKGWYDNFDNINWEPKKATGDTPPYIGTQITHSEKCKCGCQNPGRAN